MRTAVIGAAVLLALLLFGGYFGASLVTAVLTGAICWEMGAVFYGLPDRGEKTKVLLGVAWLMIFVNFLFPRTGLEALIAAFIGVFSYFLAVADRHPQALRAHFEEMVLTVFVLVYVVLFLEFLPMLRKGPDGVRWLLLFLVIVWAGDTAAYFGGRRFGKRRLYPLLSPKKTVEGAALGLVGSMLAALVFQLVAFRGLSPFSAVFAGAVVGAFAQIGDLCESMFKRAYGIKDTGRTLPGHGGVLDRFDSVVFSLPVMYLCMRLFA